MTTALLYYLDSKNLYIIWTLTEISQLAAFHHWHLEAEPQQKIYSKGMRLLKVSLRTKISIHQYNNHINVIMVKHF